MRNDTDRIRRVAHDPLDCRWWQEADDPWQFLAWCLEAGELLETGRVFTRIPCYVDGTNNGLQLLSLLLRDPVGGAATNCLPGPRRDIYQDIADGVTARLREVDDDTARGWLSWFPEGRMPRAATKRPVMTLPYGCTPYSARQYMAAWYEEEVRQGQAGPWGGRGEYRRCEELANHLWAVIEQTLGPALALMRWFRECSDLLVKHDICPAWTAPTGFPVRQPYPNWRTRKISTRLGERVLWIQHREDAAGMNKRRHRNGLPPNFIHSLDAAVLAQAVSLFDGGVPVSTIHDSFGTLAPHVDHLGQCVRAAVTGIFMNDPLADLQRQLDAAAGGKVRFPVPPPMGTMDPQEFLHAIYAFS
jgi:DNA-directed RNA polymerase